MPKKQTKKKVEESEEESEQSERSEEESEEKDSDEGSDEGSDKEDSDEEENSDKSEKSDDDESGSDKDSDDDKSEKSDDDESGSDKDSDDEESDEDSDEDSDDSGKKKKKKKGGKKDKKSDKKGGKKGGKDDKKGKKDDKKGKGKEEPEKKKVSIVTPISGPTPTLASVIQDLDDLSMELAKTFPSFRPEGHTPEIKTSSSAFQRNQFEDIRLQSPPTTTYGNGHHYHPPTREEMPMRALRKPYSEPVFNSDYKAGTGTYAGEHKPLNKDRSIQYEEQNVRNPSPEAVRAVNEYKHRREQEKKKETGLIDRSVGSIHDMVIEPFSTSGTINRKEGRGREAQTGSDGQGYGRDTMPEIVERDERAERTGRRSQERTEEQDQRDYEYGMSRSRKNFAKSSQLAEDYYGQVRKISTSPQRKTLQDLYKHKPKPMYVESGNKQPVDRYHANSQSYGQQSGQYRIQHSGEKQGTQQNFRQSGYSNKNQNEGGDNKRLINNAMEVLLKKSQNKY